MALGESEVRVIWGLQNILRNLKKINFRMEEGQRCTEMENQVRCDYFRIFKMKMVLRFIFK